MNDSGTVVQVAFFGIIAAFVAWLLFGAGSRSATPGFRVFPASAAEWVAYWFHTLEFVLFCFVLLASHKGARYVPLVGLEGVCLIACGAVLLLLVSAVVFWRRAPSLAHAAFGWSIFSLVYFALFYPVISAVKES